MIEKAYIILKGLLDVKGNSSETQMEMKNVLLEIEGKRILL